MATITVQRGHCFRKSGATGTHREQEFANAIGTRLADALRDHGHTVHLIGADDAVPASDAFIALHTDGSSNRARRGASVGYPDAKGAVLARAWKEAHTAAGYPGGWLADNYTAALKGYYGFRKSRAPYRFLAEHATTTNAADERWLAENIDKVVHAHVTAIGKVLGHPNGNTPRVMGLGDRGADVESLQRKLNEFGYGLAVDGDFGPATDAAVRDFQGKQALGVDGLVGSQTLTTLYDANKDSWVVGAIREKWLAVANLPMEAGTVGLGEPLTRELKCPDGRGRFNHFQRGSIYWTPERGAWVVRGQIRLAWERIGWEASFTGYPVGDEGPSTREGFLVEQHFERAVLRWNHGVVVAEHEVWRG